MHIHDLMSLKGQIAVVTGGYGMYGHPISQALAEAGAHVVIAARDLGRCQQAADEFVAAGLQASAARYDQASESSILALRDELLSRHGQIDVLVNNSVRRAMKRYEDPLADWQASMEVNATGLFAVTRAFCDAMMHRGSGSIINIGSIQSVCAPRLANYAGTPMTTPPDYHFHKHGIIGLTRYLAAYAGPRGVRVNAVSPGGYNPAGFTEPFKSQYLRNCPIPRPAEHDDIKGAIVFLASRASAYITGQNIMVDGGYSA